MSYYLPSEPEVVSARLPKQLAEADFGIAVARRLPERVLCGWFGTAALRERGWFGLVDPEGPLAGMVGDALRLSVPGGSVTVYVAGSVRGAEWPLAVTRRAYMELATLAERPTLVTVEVLA